MAGNETLGAKAERLDLATLIVGKCMGVRQP